MLPSEQSTPAGSSCSTAANSVANAGEILQNHIMYRLHLSQLWPLCEVSKSFKRSVLKTCKAARELRNGFYLLLKYYGLC
ncbi:hypothetical protein M427DRAFT_152608 [Gonapodya prolifera JEL478]|uniref:Uncharacterized protein n=1 Tax=Gonapodya prolifera (strain JEL478) TaxID=1344416 RepID=A0A139AQR4_GONPJ|nr:hypothetical protein M427DRAFT_152608 [Gonapodya prolifera JEL478]|eukprot:KXS19076.1 hypothetical protein M427DRAFT_152608 [Gonapodya prolifera JEL478]